VSRCRAPVTGAAADEYNLNVVDCNASVTVAHRSSISVSGGLGVPPGLTVVALGLSMVSLLNTNKSSSSSSSSSPQPPEDFGGKL